MIGDGPDLAAEQHMALAKETNVYLESELEPHCHDHYDDFRDWSGCSFLKLVFARGFFPSVLGVRPLYACFFCREDPLEPYLCACHRSAAFPRSLATRRRDVSDNTGGSLPRASDETLTVQAGRAINKAVHML